MTDPLDKKSKEKRDKLDVDLDAMLDEAKSSLLPIDEFSDDEDAIDRLLINAGFDSDEALIGTERDKAVDVVKEVDEDDLPGFDGFAEDFSEPAGVAQTAAEAAFNESQDDEDTIDRLLMNAGFDTDEAGTKQHVSGLDESDYFDELNMIRNDQVEASAPVVAEASAVEELDVEDEVNETEESDDFSDFSDFNEPDRVGQDSPATVDVATEEIDEFFGLGDDFDESDLIQDEPLAASAAVVTEVSAIVEGSDVEDEELDDFSDFSDFNEPDRVQQDSPETATVEADASEPATEPSSDDVDLSDEEDDDDDFSRQIEAQLAEAEKLSVQANLAAADNGEQAAVNQLPDAEDDSTLPDADFDMGAVLEQTAGKQDELSDDADLNEIDDFFQLDEVSDDFSKHMEDQLAEAENPSTQDTQEDDFLLPDFDITADVDISDAGIKEDGLTEAFAGTDFLSEDEALPTFEPETEGGTDAVAEPAPNQTLAAGTAEEDIESAKLSPFGFEQEDIKKQLEDAEKKVKKAKLLAYVSLGFGAVAVSAAVGLGVMTYGAKTEVAKLTDDVSTLEASLAKIAANNPNEEINAMMSSVVQLNQQVYGFITELKGNPQFPIDLLDNKVPDIVAKQEMVSKALAMLEVKVGGLEGKTSSLPPVAEPPKVEAAHQSAPAKEDHAHEIAPVKTEVAHAPAKAGVTHESEPAKPSLAKKEPAHESVPTKEGTAHETAPGKVEASHGAAPAKADAAPKTAAAKAEAVTKNTPVKVAAAPVAAQVKTPAEAVTPKPATPPKTVVKQEPVKLKKPETAAIWGVNLVAFKQEWFAKSKAAEFARQGVYAEVIPVPGNMYRLRVGGFKSKAEANANKDRIKKALNLDSVWVSDN